MKKKSLIALMVAGAIATMPLGLVGCCTNEKEIETSEGATIAKTDDILIGKNLIVALYEKHVTLHRADMYGTAGLGSGYTASILTHNKKVVTNCLTEEEKKVGIKLDNTRVIEYPSVAVAQYDEICHVCFPDEV